MVRHIYTSSSVFISKYLKESKIKNKNVIYGWNDEPCIGMHKETNPDLVSLAQYRTTYFGVNVEPYVSTVGVGHRFFRMSKWDIPHDCWHIQIFDTLHFPIVTDKFYDLTHPTIIVYLTPLVTVSREAR